MLTIHYFQYSRPNIMIHSISNTIINSVKYGHDYTSLNLTLLNLVAGLTL